MQSLEVKLIASNDAQTGERFGISEERFEELSDISANLMKKHDGDTISVIAELSKSCIHPNELAFFSFAIGRYEADRSNPFSHIMSFLSK